MGRGYIPPLSPPNTCPSPPSQPTHPAARTLLDTRLLLLLVRKPRRKVVLLALPLLAVLRREEVINGHITLVQRIVHLWYGIVHRGSSGLRVDVVFLSRLPSHSVSVICLPLSLPLFFRFPRSLLCLSQRRRLILRPDSCGALRLDLLFHPRHAGVHRLEVHVHTI